MHKTLIGWATVALMGMATLAGPAVAQTAPAGTAGSTTNAGRTGAAPMKEAAGTKDQSGADQKAAEAACQSRKGADQKTCLDAVKARQRQSQAELAGKTGAARTPTAPDTVPAVQTQSSTVGATGVAPSPAGPDRTPGTTAVPRK